MKKTVMSKLTAIVLALALCLTFTPIVAFAAGPDTPNTCEQKNVLENTWTTGLSFTQALERSKDEYSTIKLLQDITWPGDLAHSDGAVTIDLNGHNLTFTGGLKLTQPKGDNYMQFSGPGKVTMDSFKTAGRLGINAYEGAQVTVNGNATGSNMHFQQEIVYAKGAGSSVTVNGNVSGDAADTGVSGAHTRDSGHVRIKGNLNVNCPDGHGAWTAGGTVKIDGDVICDGTNVSGVHAESGGGLIVGGSVTVKGSNGRGASTYGTAQLDVGKNVTLTGIGGRCLDIYNGGIINVGGNVKGGPTAKGIEGNQGFFSIGGDLKAGVMAMDIKTTVVFVDGEIAGTVQFNFVDESFIVGRQASDDSKYVYMYKHGIDTSRVYELKSSSPKAKALLKLSKLSVTKITVGKKKMTVTWKKAPASQIFDGYQLRYRVKGTSKWTTKTFAASKASATIKSLKAKKIYQVQVRSCRKASGHPANSDWSNTKESKKIK